MKEIFHDLFLSIRCHVIVSQVIKQDSREFEIQVIIGEHFFWRAVKDVCLGHLMFDFKFILALFCINKSMFEYICLNRLFRA